MLYSETVFQFTITDYILRRVSIRVVHLIIYISNKIFLLIITAYLISHNITGNRKKQRPDSVGFYKRFVFPQADKNILCQIFRFIRTANTKSDIVFDMLPIFQVAF